MNVIAVLGGATIQGLVFDLDGVLIQSRAAHAQAFQEVLVTLGITGFDYYRFAGWRTRDVFREVIAERPGLSVAEATIAEFSRRKSERARELLASDCQIVPDCVPAIERLSHQFSVALASSGSHATVQAFLDRTGLRVTFRSVLSGDDVERAKPDPEIFRRSFDALGLPPSNCVVIEDAVAGVLAARSAGAHALGVTTEHPERLLAAGAARVVESLGELVQLLA